MNRQQATGVLRKVVAFQPRQNMDELTTEAWAEALADVDYHDALEAVTTLAKQPRAEWNPVHYFEVRDIIAEVGRMRHARLQARRHQLPEPPTEVADDPAAYQQWWAETCRAAESRHWTPPRAIEQHPARPVGSLVARIAGIRKTA